MDARERWATVEPPLTALFIDCDSYFASVEQQLRPELRGRPVGVVPVMAESTCCIAASYEAKAYGVRTGTRVSEARRLCPEIALVESRTAAYVEHHHRVVAAVERCIAVKRVLSIDEMWAWLPFNVRDPETVRELAVRIKESVAREVGESIKVSIGAGPNQYLAKLASKMRKPDGLMVMEAKQLPDVLHGLSLRDFHGIGRKMEMRLHSVGIHTATELCEASPQKLRQAWSGVSGDRLWHLLRGKEIPEQAVSQKKSLGHSHVLPPESRSPEKAWPILCKLLHKACERLRSHGLLAGTLSVQLAFVRGPRWGKEATVPETDATIGLMRLLDRLWRERPDPQRPVVQVGVVLSRLVEHGNYTPELFREQGGQAGAEPEEEKYQRLDAAVDLLRRRYGKNVVYFGGVQGARDGAPMRIAFQHVPDVGLEGDGVA